MSVHYNAFISYRHSPVDSRIAALVQRSLERFRVPGAIRKKTGIKRIHRLFRDKEELPITSDLNDDIAEALANSDYLIVICSPRTGESVWVEREIETFLKNHTRHQVLTVLAEGEPSETIPEILRYDWAPDPATGVVRRVPIEPLSCDWRMSDRRAKREELPRLAAAILGCGYDELRQRQRQYKMRRITAGFSAALAASLLLTAYFVRTSIEIRENYEDALRNQSSYLASEAVDVLEDGDRMTAIQLALAALPDESRDRPVVPEAQLALSKAVGAYVADTTDPVAVAAFVTEGTPKEVKVDPEKARVYILDDQNLLTIWDVNTSQRIAAIRPNDTVDGLRIVGGRIVLWFGDYIASYAADTGELLWQQEFTASDLAVAPDGSTIIAVGYDTDYNQVLSHLDIVTGEITYQYAIESYHENLMPAFYALEEDHISPDGTLIGFSAGGSYTDEQLGYVTDRRVYVYDWRNGAGSFIAQPYYLIGDFCFTEDNDVILAGNREDDGSFGLGSSYAFYNSHTLQASSYDIMRVDRETGAVTWQTQMDYYQVSYRMALRLCPGNTEVLCTAANVCYYMDCATGEILGRGETTAAIIDVRMEDGRDYAQFILQDGSMASFGFSDARCTCRPYFVDNLAAAELTRGTDGYNNIYVCQLYGNQVLRYSFGVRDENLQRFDGVEADAVDTAWVTEDYLVTLNYSKQLCIYSQEEQRQLFCVELEEEESYSANEMEALGLSEDGARLYFCCQGYGLPDVLRSYDLASGTYTDDALPAAAEYYMKALPVVDGDTIYCAMERYGGGTTLCWRTFEETDWNLFDLPGVQDSVTAQLLICGDRVIVCDETGVCRRVDPESREVDTLEPVLWQETLGGYQFIWDASGEHIAAVEQARIVLCDGEGAVRGEIALNDRKVHSLAFHEDTLFVLGSDYYLYRYDLDGTFLSRSDIASYINASSDPEVEWHFLADGNLALICDGVFNLISCDGWKISGYAAQAIGYDVLRDRLLVYTSLDEGYAVGAFSRYSTRELVEMGKSLVGEGELSEETRSQYGIS